MSGLIKSDFKKLFKSRYLIICVVIAVALSAFTAYSFHLIYDMSKDLENTMQMFDMMGMSSEEYQEYLSQLLVGKDAMSMINMILSDSSVEILIAICACIFVSSEYTMGTLKNTISRGFSKNSIYFSKAVVVAVSAVILGLAYFLGGAVTAFICSEPGDFNTIQVISELLVYLLLVIALAMMFFMAAMLIRKTGISIAVCIAAPVLIDTIIVMFSGVVENMDNYIRFWIPNTFTLISSSYSDSTMWLPIIVALAYIAVTYFIGTFVFSKRDVK